MTISTKDIANALSVSERQVLRRATKEGWKYLKAGKAKVWDVSSLAPDVQVAIAPKLRPVPAPAPISGTEAVHKASEKARELGRLRLAFLALYDGSGLKAADFIAAYNSGALNPTLRQKLGEVSLATLYRWDAKRRTSGTAGVIPRWGETKKTTKLTDIEQQILEKFYLSPERRTIQHCYQLLKLNLPSTTATYQTCRRYLQSLPKPLVAYHRLGQSRFEALYQPFIDRDPSIFLPMQQVVSDHHRFDLLVTKDGRIFRPWITAWQDYRSGKILGWAPSVYPSSLTILQAFYMMVMRYGLPEMCHMDNGKDYRCKVLMGASFKVNTITAQGVSDEDLLHLQGTFQMLGVQTTYARAYHGQSKGRMERTFGTFAEYISKDSGYYIGSNTVSRPEDVTLYYRAINKKAKKQVLLSWDEFCTKLDAFIEFWNANWHGEGKGMNGQTPDEVFALHAPEPRKADAKTLALALTRPEVRKVTRNGVSVMGVQYWAPELLEYSGQEVVVRIPIVKPDTALVQTIQGQTICTAWADYFMATGDVAVDNEKVNAARKSNLELVRHRSERLKQTSGLKTFLDLPAPQRQELPDLSALPLAAGAEPVRQREQKPSLRSPLDI